MYKLRFSLENLEGNNDLRAFFGQRKMNFMTCVKQIQEECSEFQLDLSDAEMSMEVSESSDGYRVKVVGPTATWMLREAMKTVGNQDEEKVLRETWCKFSSYLSRYGSEAQVLSKLAGTLKSMHFFE